VVARVEGSGAAARLVSVAEGSNQVTSSNDPTAHAEVVALRAAGAALGTFDLSGCVLLASCEPCPMCLTAGLWARVDAMWFAATRTDAAAAGFDDDAFYRALETPREQWAVPVRRLQVPDATAPFEAWGGWTARTEY
jgi:guanine deaminase